MQASTEARQAFSAPRVRIFQLDTLRGIAVLLVFLLHGLQAYSNAGEDSSGPMGAIDLGRVGVVVFFLISGFVIVRAFRDRSLGSTGLFWKHRFFRLFPAFWLTVGIAALLSAAGVSRISHLASTISPADALGNLTMMPHLFGARMAVGVFWTLQVELVFYLVISLAVVIFPMGRLAYAALAFGFFILSIGYAGFLVMSHQSDQLSTNEIYLGLLHLSIMFCGAGLRLHWDSRDGRAAGFVKTMPLELKCYFGAVMGFLAVYTLTKIRTGIDIHTFRAFLSYGLAFAIFLAGMTSLGFSRLGKFLGDRSYGMYLLHMPVIAILYVVTLSGQGQPMLPQPVFVILALVASIAAASAMYRLVEQPSNRLSHRRERKTTAPSTSSVPAATLVGRMKRG